MLIEICCGSLEDALAAEEGGADRIELNSALFLGGLTPSLGTVVEVKRQTKFPVLAMIRPRVGGFDYSEAEFAVMRTDARFAVEQGADGLVFGCLHSDGCGSVGLLVRRGPHLIRGEVGAKESGWL